VGVCRRLRCALYWVHQFPSSRYAAVAATRKRYQKALIQEMERPLLPIVPIRLTTDKRSRLQVLAAIYQKTATVLFPTTGFDELRGQIFNLGIESHADLCDGLTALLQGLVQQGLELPKIQWIET